MKYIKTYEIFKNFSFLRKKKDPFSTPDLKDIVEDSLIDLSDLGFTIVVDIEMNRVRDNVGNPISSDPSVKIKIHKKENSVDYNEFNVSEILETLRFALPFLQKEYGLELYDISYNEMGWTYSRNKMSGTKKLHSYSKLKRVKDIPTKTVNIVLKDRTF